MTIDWMLLVVVTLTAVVAWQAWETRKAAQAARISADTAASALLMSRPFLELEEGSLGRLQTLEVVIDFKLRNYGQTAARLESIERHAHITNGEESQGLDAYRVMIPPGASTPVTIRLGTPTEEQEIHRAHRDTPISITLRGVITYTDQFGETHRRHFAWYILAGQNDTQIDKIGELGYNEEESWGKKSQSPSVDQP
jgi:hypothetical protein